MATLECSRCLLTDDVPGVRVDNTGLCSVCIEYDRVYGDWKKKEDERISIFKKILNNARKKTNIYDVLVPISGGKDSTYVLYLCRKVYNLKCLAVTFDNGFLSEHARENIRNSCEALKVDHIYYSINKPYITRLYRHFFLKTGFFCPICMSGIAVAQRKIQVGFNIPLALKGTSSLTEEHVSPEFFLPGLPSFLENVLKESPLEKEAEILLNPIGVFTSPSMVQMPDYVNWDYDNIYNVIKNELGWKEKDPEEEHGDCMLSKIVDYIRFRKFPVLIPGKLRLSKLVTCGQMNREEAAKKVTENMHLTKEPGNLNWVLNVFDITREEFDMVLSDPMRHYKYLKNRSPIIRRLIALKNKKLRFI